MTAILDARKLSGAAYASARAKVLRPVPPAPPAPIIVPGIPLGDMEPADYEAMVAARPKAVRDMTAEEYAVARRLIVQGVA